MTEESVKKICRKDRSPSPKMLATGSDGMGRSLFGYNHKNKEPGSPKLKAKEI